MGRLWLLPLLLGQGHDCRCEHAACCLLLTCFGALVLDFCSWQYSYAPLTKTRAARVRRETCRSTFCGSHGALLSTPPPDKRPWGARGPFPNFRNTRHSHVLGCVSDRRVRDRLELARPMSTATSLAADCIHDHAHRLRYTRRSIDLIAFPVFPPAPFVAHHRLIVRWLQGALTCTQYSEASRRFC